MVKAIIKRQFPASFVLTIVAAFSAFAQSLDSPADISRATYKDAGMLAVPDLRISEFAFIAADEKSVRVHVVNGGRAASPFCILRLTVRKINGMTVGRIRDVKLPPLAPGKNRWLVINAKSILPNNVSLEATTFKLNADADSIVAESNEANNEVWHNLDM